jgi:hypothetical protein
VDKVEGVGGLVIRLLLLSSSTGLPLQSCQAHVWVRQHIMAAPSPVCIHWLASDLVRPAFAQLPTWTQNGKLPNTMGGMPARRTCRPPHTSCRNIPQALQSKATCLGWQELVEGWVPQAHHHLHARWPASNPVQACVSDQPLNSGAGGNSSCSACPRQTTSA